MTRPTDPVKPSGMELVFFYCCPVCRFEFPLITPTHPSMVACERCKQRFPIVPVDESTVRFIKLILSDGAAAIDGDYV